MIEFFKRVLRLKTIHRDRSTNSATGDSLDLSDDGQASDDRSTQPIFVNEDPEYCKHLAKFFKGEK